MSQERVYKVLLGPHITEKASNVGDKHNQVVFKVTKNSNKHEIKQAVEQLFDVKVADVKVLNVKGKARTFGGIKGQRKDWKKAYVSLQEGSDINFTNLA